MAEHGGVGTPHPRGAPGTDLVLGVGEVGSFFWRSRARRLVGAMTRRRGGSSAHRPSGETPEPESRRSARSDHQTHPAATSSSWSADTRAFVSWDFALNWSYGVSCKPRLGYGPLHRGNGSQKWSNRLRLFTFSRNVLQKLRAESRPRAESWQCETEPAPGRNIQYTSVAPRPAVIQ